MENLFDNIDFNEEEGQEIELTTDADEVTVNDNNEESTDDTQEDKSETISDGIDLTEFLENTENNDNTEIDEPSSTESSSSPYNTFALALSEEGLISLNEDDKIESFVDLKNIIARTIKENEFSGLTDNQRTYLESLRNGIPEEQVISSLKNIENYSKITESQLEEDTDLRLELITQDFLSKGYDKVKAEKLAKRSVEIGEDLEDSKEALDTLKKTEANRLKHLNDQKVKESQLLQKQYEDTLTKMKDNIEKTESIIPGIPMNDRIKKELFDNMTKAVDYDDAGNPLNALGAALKKDRENLEIKLNYLFTVTKGLTDFSVLKNSTKSSVIKTLEEQLATNQTGSGKTKSSNTTQSTNLKGLLTAIDTLDL